MKVVRIASLVAALVAILLLGRMAVFLGDVDQKQLSLEPGDPWRVSHSCLTAYAEAARFAEEPDRNIYDASLYEKRFIHGLKVDTYHYPPPFLVVPGALQHVAGDYMALRPVWFVLQVALLLAALLLVARHVGGAIGPTIWLVTPLFFLAPTTLFTLQMGNFQSSAVALSLIGMIGLASRRTPMQAFGGFALAYAAISKVFPGVLGVFLIVGRRWRALAWTAFAGLAITALALALYGSGPFHDFISYQLPRLSSGEAFPQSEYPRIAATNMSFYGLLVRLRALGVDGLDIQTGLAINSIYGGLVLALAVAIAWRRRHADTTEPAARLASVQLWLALINLASFRSPFVGGAYGVIGTALLAVLLLAGATTTRGRVLAALAYAAMFASGLVIPTPLEVPSATRVAVTLAFQLATLGINAAVCACGLSRARLLSSER